jgi:lipopolysaccharide/colanic/teichoic acid biosynthesis glycosyltransferase
MKRVWQHGQLINVFKFRTMHPYSEYLQAYIYKENDLEAGGKIKNDFRITSWGKLFRKLWIDELPQFLNLLRGELSLVGVRALSEHYFSLYPKDLQELRVQFKPGLVPPYYADMPNSFEEIIESERKYLLKRQQRPFSTQIQYFFKAWWNIIVKRARSK